MLDPAWAVTPALLWVALALVLALLVFRARRVGGNEYQRFKRLRSSTRRQAQLLRWLRGSFATFGGLSIGLLILAGAYVQPLLVALSGWAPVRSIRSLIASNAQLTAGVVVGILLGMSLLTILGVRSARADSTIVAVGDIQAMLPRNRQELRIGAMLAINAGVVEELMFRLALPAVVFGATGSSLAAVLVSVLAFGALHAYQGVLGVAATTVIGMLLLALYVLTGSLLVPIVLHVLFDLRSLVLTPVAVLGVHRVDGRAAARAVAGRQ